MGRKKHPIRDSFFLFAGGMAMILIALGFEAKAHTVPDMARCYALATTSGYYAEAKRLRIALRPHRKDMNDRITYDIGYTMGQLDESSRLTVKPIAIIASKQFDKDCKE